MGLKSDLFHGDQKLESAAVSNPAHIQKGAAGAHVGKIKGRSSRSTADKLVGKRGSVSCLEHRQKRPFCNSRRPETSSTGHIKMPQIQLSVS